MSEAQDLVIVGSGLIGLATALAALEARPGLRVTVIDKEPEVAAHQSSHNSGVLHSGIYYTPGSLKARLCLQGKAAIEQFATNRAIPFERCGKVIVATSESELGRMEELLRRANANGVEGVRKLEADEIRHIEPFVRAIAGLHVPSTGIIDFRQLALAFADETIRRGGQLLLGRQVTGLEERHNGIGVTTPDGDLWARAVVTCAGLQSDRMVSLTQRSKDEQVLPFRGDYYHLVGDGARLVRNLVYPVPDPRFTFLGVHFTRRIEGPVWVGPNAVLAFKREGYRRRDFALGDVATMARFPGLWLLARRYYRTGAREMWLDISKRAFLRELRRYIPDIEAQHLSFGPTGVRAQAVSRDGTLLDEFSFASARRVLHLRNAPSPGATASLAIGELIAAQALERCK